jgi:spore germination cell wall hydrolase CwlJ-like protein
MTDSPYEADGATPDGATRSAPKVRPTAKLVALGLVLAAAGAAALSIAPTLSTTAQAPLQAAVQTLTASVASATLTGQAASADPRSVLQTLLIEAGLRPTRDLHSLSWDQARRVNALMPAVGAAPDEVARPFVLGTDSKEGRQALHCLTQAAYFEAGANGPVAEAGVVQVVLNRVRHPDFPKSVCGVVFQGSARKTGCQFSFTCDGALNRGLDAAAWNRARKVAAQALGGYVFKPVGASTYYHADYVFPYWAPTLVKMATVGPHIFYAMAGAEGRAAYLTGKYAGGELKLTKAVLGAPENPPRPTGDVRQASVGQPERIATSRGERVHMQMAALANLAKTEPQDADARLNAAQAAKPAQPAPAAPAAVAPATVAASAAPSPVASVATSTPDA